MNFNNIQASTRKNIQYTKRFKACKDESHHTEATCSEEDFEKEVSKMRKLDSFEIAKFGFHQFETQQIWGENAVINVNSYFDKLASGWT